MAADRYIKRNTKVDLNENYRLLGVAIVEQACKDAIKMPRDVREFFTNDNSIFGMCMPNVDGEALLAQVKENFYKYGEYAPPKDEETRKEAMEKMEKERWKIEHAAEWEQQEKERLEREAAKLIDQRRVPSWSV